jgi:hypothetical protein
MAGPTNRQLFQYWFAAQVAFPVVVVALSVVLALLYDVPNPFLRMVGGLDLIAVAGVVLLGVKMEIEFDLRQLNLDSDALENFSHGTFWAGVLLLMIYAGVKPYALLNEAPSSIFDSIPFAAYVLSGVSIGFYVFGAGLASFAKHKLMFEREAASP